MKGQLVYRRYAAALMAASRLERLDRKATQFKEFAEVLETNPDVQRVLTNQTLDLDIQFQALRALGEKAELEPVLLRLLDLVVHNRKTPYLRGIANAFSDLVDAHFKRVVAHVRSAFPLTASQVEALENKIAEVSKKSVRVEVEVDPELLGGISVQIGNLVVDRSLRTQLKELKNSMLAS